jgi:predicted DCC family thiol-disulfide oxidoreductase YuxK
VLLVDGVTYTKSSAVLKALGIIGMPWSVFCLFYIIPKFIRDTIYNQIAKNRYKLFGKKDSCRLPTPSEKKRFLK